MDVMWPVRGGPLEIPGGWREMQRKMHGKKNWRSHYVREKNNHEANSKVRIV